LGLAGVWGPIVKEWLEVCSPNDISSSNLHNLYIAVTPINLFQPPKLMSNFESKEDIINACMTSVHIPFFMDKNPVTKYKGKFYLK
jgi:hypothetical protein